MQFQYLPLYLLCILFVLNFLSQYLIDQDIERIIVNNEQEEKEIKDMLKENGQEINVVLKKQETLISILASLFTVYTVCSKLFVPIYFPEFTSIAVNASVLSIVINPPHFNQIFRFTIVLKHKLLDLQS